MWLGGHEGHARSIRGAYSAHRISKPTFTPDWQVAKSFDQYDVRYVVVVASNLLPPRKEEKFKNFIKPVFQQEMSPSIVP
jgi:hypothetical protein